MSKGFSRVALDTTDFVEGFQIIDGHALRFEQPIETEEDETSESMIGFDEKFSKAIEKSIAIFDRSNFLIQNGERVSAGIYISAMIDSEINNLHVGWYGLKEDRDLGDEANNELMDDLRQEYFTEFMQKIQLSWLLASRREQLREFWGESTDIRFDWIVKNYAKRQAQVDQETAKSNTMEFVKNLNKKFGREKTEGEEYKLIWSIFGLLRIGYDPKFPIILSTHDRDDKEAYKQICSAIGQYIFWTLIEKKRRDVEWDGEEPGPTLAVEDEDHRYERDCNALEKMARDGSGEVWLNMCYNSFEYKDKEGVEHQIMYRKATDNAELKQSIMIGTKTLVWIGKLWDQKRNLQSYRISRPNHVTDGFNLPNYIKYLGGKLVTGTKPVKVLVKQDKNDQGIEQPIENQTVDCKVYSKQILLDYQYKLLWKAYWQMFNEQKEKKDIAKKTYQTY